MVARSNKIAAVQS